MSKRRTAEEAFEIPASVQEFIERGVHSSAKSAPADSPIATPQADASHSPRNEKVIDLDEERHVPSTTGRVNLKRGSSRSPLPDDLTRTYAKATVQKTIRFHPKLIAELDAHTRQQELDAEVPKAFQQIQNEALDLWLERYVRRPK
jgi:hypothetical protein